MARDRKRHANDRKVPTAPSVAMSSSAALSEPHPCLIQIVRLLARHSAKADLAAQHEAIQED